MNKQISEFNLIDLFRIAYQKRKVIMWITGIAFIASVAVALLLPVYYKSSALFYPTNLGMTDRSAIFSEKQSESEFTYYGTKHDANRILTLAMSAKIVDFSINYFDLAKHYGYDTAKDECWRTFVKKEFLDNYSVIKTDKDAIEITLYDTDKELCAQIVNTIVEKIDEHSKVPINLSKQKVIGMLSKQMVIKDEQIDSLTNRLVTLKKLYSITSTGAGENAIISGNDVQQVENYKVLYAKQLNLMSEQKELNKVYAEYNVSSGDNVSAISILENAYPAERKSKPIRWLIVVLGTLLSFVLAVFGALLIEQYKSIKAEVIHP